MTGVRQTVEQRTVLLDERSDRGTPIRRRRTEDDRYVLCDQALRELERGLRIRLIVDDERERPAADAAGLIDVRLKRFERLLIGLSDERGAAGERQNHVDFIRIGSAHRHAQCSEQCRCKNRRNQPHVEFMQIRRDHSNEVTSRPG
jgi:hypothetical protein